MDIFHDFLNWANGTKLRKPLHLKTYCYSLKNASLIVMHSEVNNIFVKLSLSTPSFL